MKLLRTSLGVFGWDLYDLQYIFHTRLPCVVGSVWRRALHARVHGWDLYDLTGMFAWVESVRPDLTTYP